MQFTALIPNAVGFSYHHITAHTIHEARKQLLLEGFDKTIKILPSQELSEAFEKAALEAKRLEDRCGFEHYNIIAF